MAMICDNGVMREMTDEEKNILDNLPDPSEILPDSDEIVKILLGGDQE